MPKLAMAGNCKSKRVYSSAMLFAINSATKARTTTVVPTQETTAAVKGLARTVETIDPLKKKRCFVALQKLMEHRDGRAFKNGKGFAADCHLSSKPLMDFETVLHKLDKGFYANPDQFAGDVRILFCNAMLYYPANHEIHRIAEKLSDLFEFKWKSMENLCAAETEREKAEQQKPKRKPKEERGAARMRVQQTKRTVFLDENLNSFKELEKLCGYSLADSRISNALMEDIGLVLKPERKPLQTVVVARDRGGSLAGTKRKLSSALQSGNEENLRSQASSKKARVVPKSKQHFLDTILVSQSSLFGLQRKKEREVARMMVQQSDGRYWSSSKILATVTW
ncbi:uncharacterized protein LOC130742469 [Lotus japonicus]|uniref:uncharacterized protein LOC130742469 n=1 Tax=Lotus japonicus TaxID=34305 RepID=UPI002589A97F|nr:uncharacterized protein LOC130742469 [Lotus japonicus]